MQILDTIKDAVVELSVLSPSEMMPGDDAKFALREFNRILDNLNTQNLMQSYLKWTEYSKESWGSDTVTIGIDGSNDIVSIPPQNIQEMFFRQDQTDYHLSPMSSTQYASRSYKLYSSIPSKYFLNRLGKDRVEISFNYVPLFGLKLHILAKEAYAPVALNDDIEWGTGIESYLKLKLAVNLANSYNINVPQALSAKAIIEENQVKAFNYKPKTLSVDSTLTGRRGRSIRHNPARM